MKKSILHLAIPTAALALVFSLVSWNNNGELNINTVNALRTMNNNAYQPGEFLRYRIHYGAVNAGIVSMTVAPQTTLIGNKNTYNLRVEGETVKSFEWAYKVRDKFESWVDQGSQAPLRYAKTVREDRYFYQDLAIYDHENAKLRNTKGELKIPAYTQDVASAIYYMRNLNYKTAVDGTQFPINVYMDNKVYNLNVTLKGRETIKSDIGKVKCIKIKPQLVVDRVFKNSDAMTVWVTDDENHIPVRIESALRVGSIKVDIIEYKGLKNSFSALIPK